MKLNSHIAMAANPDLMFHTHVKPLSVEVNGEASLEIATGTIHAALAEIPASFAIPFMPPHRRRVMVASIGPFDVRIHPAQASICAFGVRIGGVLGTGDGATTNTHVQGKCRLEIDLTGEMPGRILKAAVEGVFEE
jgi:hypothetical protein